MAKYKFYLYVVVIFSLVLFFLNKVVLNPSGVFPALHSQAAYNHLPIDLPIDLGGETSRSGENDKAFSSPVANIKQKNIRSFFFGNSLFNTSWTAFPGSVASLDGLGPIFNRSSCSACHLKDGRGRPPIKEEKRLLSILIRLKAISTKKNNFGYITVPHPRYGSQLQTDAISGVAPEAKVEIIWKTIKGNFADGKPYELRKPSYRLIDEKYPDSSKAKGLKNIISARVAPFMIGLGLLEAIPEKAIKKMADPNDQNKDGISGRYLLVNDLSKPQGKVIGRFGWKGDIPSIRQQVVIAAINDMGISNPVFKEECMEKQADCLAETKDSNMDMSELQLNKITLYSSLLAVPKRRNILNSSVRRGEQLFTILNCNACHRLSWKTGNKVETLSELRSQNIFPLTDLLLHDMGSGLAEGGDTPIYTQVSDGGTNFVLGREWRTSPLWGIGLIPTVNKHSFYLHDGRARNLEEAILWHGGEAEKMKKAYVKLPLSQRNDLINFLNSL